MRIEDIKTVGIFLGPYRNFTTLTTSLLFLHKNCQVLNHGGKHILETKEYDFLLQQDNETFNRFIDFAISLSSGGERGMNGGSITHSHAFDEKHNLREIFHKTGETLIKKKITSLVWKESFLVSQHIRNNNVNIPQLLQKNKKIRFLMPIRNPLDCATSNLHTNMVRFNSNLGESPSFIKVFETIIDEFVFFEDLRERNPDRFFSFLQHDFNEKTFEKLAKFLELEYSEEWKENISQGFILKGAKHRYPQKLLDETRRIIERKCARKPRFLEDMTKFYEVMNKTELGK